MERTLYFCRSSLLSGDMIFLRTCEGALKWRLWFLLRSEVTKGFNFMVTVCNESEGRSEGVLSGVPEPVLHLGHSYQSLRKCSTGGRGFGKGDLREETGDIVGLGVKRVRRAYGAHA